MQPTTQHKALRGSTGVDLEAEGGNRGPGCQHCFTGRTGPGKVSGFEVAITKESHLGRSRAPVPVSIEERKFCAGSV